jgi:ABC-type spermidine/putrescine transport system permease subunit I
VKKPIAGGAGNAVGTVALPRSRTTRPAQRGAWLENERVLAAVLLAPTVLLLGVFIAYPFVMGVWLALSNTSVGNPGHFVGIKNFVKAWNDSIFRTAFWNTTWYTAWATLFKLALGIDHGQPTYFMLLHRLQRLSNVVLGVDRVDLTRHNFLHRNA